MGSDSDKGNYVEKAFTEIALFAYNYVYSIVFLLLRPISGPVRLSVRRRLRRNEQLGPHTVLFATWCWIYALLTSSTTDIRSLIGGYILSHHLPVAVTQLATASFTALVALDIGVRGLGAWKYRTKRRKRQRFVDVALFACCPAIICAAVVAIPIAQEFMALAEFFR